MINKRILTLLSKFILTAGVVFSFLSGVLQSQNPIKSERLAERIQKAYLNSDYDSLLILGERWINYTKWYNDSELPLDPIGVILDASKLRNDYTTSGKFIERLRVLLDKRKVFTTDSISYVECETVFNYFYHKSNLEINKSRYAEAVISLNKSKELVTRHRYRYAKVTTYTKRLMQANRELASVYIDTKNYSQAKVHLAHALSQAKFIDSVNNYYNFQYVPSVLSLYLRLSQKDGNLDFWYKNNLDITNKSVTNTNAIINFLKEVIKSDSVTSITEEAVKILKKLPAFQTDPDAILRIAAYYIHTHRPEPGKKYLYFFENKIYPQNLSNEAKTTYHILKAKIYLQQNKLSYLEHELKKAEKYVFENSEGPNTASLLSGIKSILFLYNQVYTRTKETNYLKKALLLAEENFNSLIELRQIAEKARDRSDLMIEFDEYIDDVIKTYYNAYEAGQHINQNTLINYFEIKKSFNLRNETKLKLEAMSELQRTMFGKIQMQLSQLENQKRTTDAIIDSLEIKIGFLENEKEVLLSKIKNIPWQSPSLQEIQSNLTESKCIVNYYLTKHQEVYFIVIEKHGFRMYRQPFTNNHRKQVADLHTTMQKALEMNTDSRDSIWSAASFELFTVLLRPIPASDFKSIIIIPDGLLTLIPFGALLTDKITSYRYVDWPYLIKSHSISVQHSMQLWFENNFSTATHKGKKKLKILAPFFENLTYNLLEKKELLKLVNTSAAIKGEVLLENLDEESKDAQILHIASHAKSSFISDASTYIRGQSDTLTALQIANKEFNQDLIVLSACETGIGEEVRGEGIFSLSRSFLKAGAKSVISTLWQIHDKISEQQVVYMYKELIKGKSKEEAIRAVQLAYIQGHEYGNKYAMPYYWAAYLCHGDLRPILGLEEKSYTVYLTVISLLVITIITGFLKYTRKI